MATGNLGKHGSHATYPVVGAHNSECAFVWNLSMVEIPVLVQIETLSPVTHILVQVGSSLLFSSLSMKKF